MFPSKWWERMSVFFSHIRQKVADLTRVAWQCLTAREPYMCECFWCGRRSGTKYRPGQATAMPSSDNLPNMEGDMTIDPCETYKYLGETLNTKNNINDHIKEIERKTEAALQSALYIAGDDNYRGIEMETIWTLIESCIIPIITYGSETWDINQNQTKRLNRILDNIIKRILNLPQSTPRECLYYELGTLDIEHRIITKRINYATTLLIKNPDNLRDIGLLQTTNPKSWIQKTRQQARSVGLDLETLRHISANDRKVSVKESTTKTMNDKHDTEGQNKSKFNFLTSNSGTRRRAKPSYLYKLPKEQARAIFMARTRMIKVKTNYKNM